MKGSGDRVVTLRLPRGPLVFTLANGGSSNFIVRLSGPGGTDYLVNEIGPWAGATVAERVRPGRYRLAIQAEGSWFAQASVPRPANFTRPLVKTHSFRTAMVFPVRSSRAGDIVASARATGRGNFVVRLVGVGHLRGTELVFNEIAPYRGQALVDVPAGPLLLWVQAPGRWSLRFRR